MFAMVLVRRSEDSLLAFVVPFHYVVVVGGLRPSNLVVNTRTHGALLPDTLLLFKYRILTTAEELKG